MQCKWVELNPVRYLTWKKPCTFPMKQSELYFLYHEISCRTNRHRGNLSATVTNKHRYIVSVKYLHLFPFISLIFFEESFVVIFFYSCMSAVDKLFLFSLIHFLLFFQIFSFSGVGGNKSFQGLGCIFGKMFWALWVLLLGVNESEINKIVIWSLKN